MEGLRVQLREVASAIRPLVCTLLWKALQMFETGPLGKISRSLPVKINTTYLVYKEVAAECCWKLLLLPAAVAVAVTRRR